MAFDEIELQLPPALRRQRAEDELQRRLALQPLRDLPDRQEVGEAVLARLTRPDSLPQQAPLFQIAEMAFGDGRIEAANIAQEVRTGRG